MSSGAKVRSIDTLRKFRVAMSSFGCAASQSMAAVEVEIRRTLDWLKHDQVKFWQQEVPVARTPSARPGRI